MKTRFLVAAMLLLAFGTARAQDTITVVKRGADSKKADTLQIITPDMSGFPELMQELGVYLQKLTDSVDWDSFEEDIEQWGADMEEWGRKMEEWGKQYEKSFNYPFNESLPKKGRPEVSSVKVCGSGDVLIRQVTDGFSLTRDDKFTSNYELADGAVILMGSSDYQVAIQQLESVYVTGSGDVFGQGTIKGKNLAIYDFSSSDVRMSVDYDTIRVKMTGSGDVALSGRCKVLYADMWGSGDLRIPQLVCGETNVAATGSGEVYDGKSRDVISYSSNWKQWQYEKGLLLDPNWQGFEAGLNMLMNPIADFYTDFGGTEGMALRPLRSWYFGFNIADVGIAFNRKHTVGLFTGVGIGWNNFSWNNDVTIEYDPDNVVYTVVPIDHENPVKNSKYGALFLQMPLMLEVRPARSLYIDAGVTAGLRFAQWNKVRYEDGSKDKHYFSGPLNQFKLDASLRVGGSDLGFFANYALLPIFNFGNEKAAHPLSFGFSINF